MLVGRYCLKSDYTYVHIYPINFITFPYCPRFKNAAKKPERSFKVNILFFSIEQLITFPSFRVSDSSFPQLL